MKKAETIFDPEARDIVRCALAAVGEYAVGCGLGAENVLDRHRDALAPEEQKAYELIIQAFRSHAVAAGMLRFRIGEHTKQITESN
jgi:hypothetical protein